jgi:ubiquinone/menaquinone biosynthesis C-methylase UbiE
MSLKPNEGKMPTGARREDAKESWFELSATQRNEVAALHLECERDGISLRMAVEFYRLLRDDEAGVADAGMCLKDAFRAFMADKQRASVAKKTLTNLRSNVGGFEQSLPNYTLKNGEFFDIQSALYRDRELYPFRHDPSLHPSWGAWFVSDNAIGVFAEVDGKEILELGCGDAHNSIALAKCGAKVTGLDLSSGQLARAEELARNSNVRLTFVHANAVALPFATRSFDIVFSDYGATDFTDPQVFFPEVARVLRKGGIFAICTFTPWLWACVDPATGKHGSTLMNNYFSLRHVKTSTLEWFVHGYGEVINLSRSSGFIVDRLVELIPSETSKNLKHPLTSWARNWPVEHLWVLRREN